MRRSRCSQSELRFFHERWGSGLDMGLSSNGYESNLTTRGPQVLVLVSIHQGSIWGTDF